MEYKISPFSAVWNKGIFNVPVTLVDNYLKLASEYQIKALLFVLRSNGQSTSEQIAKALGQTPSDIDNLLEFWVEEGVLSTQFDQEAAAPAAHIDNEEDKPKPKKEALSAPRLSPKDVVDLLKGDEGLRFLVTQAQSVLGRSISHAEQEMLINMVNYYGLNPEVVLMILEFYRSEKQKGRSIGIAYVNAMAKDWAEEGIATIADAEEKLKAIERSDRLWKEVVAITGIRHKRPTAKQREMVSQWFDDFDVTMITIASDIMKENIPEPKLAYINSILSKWKKNNIKTPSDYNAYQQEYEKQKAQKEKTDNGKLRSKPSYDLDQIKKNALNNTEI